MIENVLNLKNYRQGENFRAALNQIYREIPNTSCECERLGQCCELTPEEMRSDFATMYPLYAVEYLNIVEYVEAVFPPEERDRVFGVIEERPARCPFLTDSGQCAIHPVRPLTCRTYGVLRQEHLLQSAHRHKDLIPVKWISDFLAIESTTICTKSRVLNPVQIARHADQMIQGVYDRAMIELSGTTPLAKDRGRILRDLTDMDRIKKWTWGGFNALFRSSQEWFKSKFSDYWKRSELGI